MTSVWETDERNVFKNSNTFSKLETALNKKLSGKREVQIRLPFLLQAKSNL